MNSNLISYDADQFSLNCCVKSHSFSICYYRTRTKTRMSQEKSPDKIVANGEKSNVLHNNFIQ